MNSRDRHSFFRKAVKYDYMSFRKRFSLIGRYHYPDYLDVDMDQIMADHYRETVINY